MINSNIPCPWLFPMRIGLSEREKINKKETRVKIFKSNIPQNHCETVIRPNKGPEIGMQLEQIHIKYDRIKGPFSLSSTNFLS